MLGARRFACRYFGICLRARGGRALLACLYLLRSELPAARARAAASHTARTKRRRSRARPQPAVVQEGGCCARTGARAALQSVSFMAHKRHFFLRGGSLFFGRPFFFFFFCAFRHARARTRVRTHGRRRTTRRAIRRRGWLEHCTGGSHEANAHRLGALLLTRPLSPCPCKAAVPKGPVLLFLKLHPRK